MGRLVGRVFGAAVFLLVFAVATAASAQKPQLAIMPLSAKRLPAETVEILEVILVNDVASLGTYDVISASDINAMLGFEKMKEALGCDDVACAAEIGGALGVDFFLSGSIGKLGNELFISLTLIDANEQKIIKRTQSRVADDEALYAKALSEAIVDVFGSAPAGRERRARRPDRPSEAYGISPMEWQHYLYYRKLAATAQIAPLDLEEWMPANTTQKKDWVDYFKYRHDELRRGGELMAYDAWYRRARMGGFYVKATPEKVRVLVDGKEVGESPLSVELPPGEYVVKVKASGHLPQERKVTLLAGQRQPLQFELSSFEAFEAERQRAINIRGTQLRVAKYSLITAGVLSSAVLVLYVLTPSEASIQENEYQAYLEAESPAESSSAYAAFEKASERRSMMINLARAGALVGSTALVTGLAAYNTLHKVPELRAGVGVSANSVLFNIGYSF